MIGVLLAAVCALGSTLSNVAAAHRHNEKYEDTYNDEEYKDISNELEKLEHSVEDIKKDENIQHTTKQLTPKNETDIKYEVTENGVDIPNNVAITGPIIKNFTLTRPLNTVVGSNSLEKEPSVEEVPLKPKKHSFSIFHIRADFEDDKPNKPELNLHPSTHAFNFDNLSLKEYLNGVQRGLTNGIKSIQQELNKSILTPNIVAAPAKYLQALQRKGSDAVREFHNVVFGNRA